MTHPYRMRSARPGRKETELRRLERELAEDTARTDIASFGQWHEGEGDDPIERVRTSWHCCRAGTDADARADAEYFNRACRYLELRGLLELHPSRPGLVRALKEETQ